MQVQRNAAIQSSRKQKSPRLQQSNPDDFQKAQDCSNPVSKSNPRGKIAAIRRHREGKRKRLQKSRNFSGENTSDCSNLLIFATVANKIAAI